MAAPSVAVYKDVYTTTAASTRVLAQQTVATGDVAAVIWHTADYTNGIVSSLAKSAGTATITTPALAQAGGVALHCGNSLFTFTVTAGGTLTLTGTFSTSTPGYNTAWTYVATGCGGIGNSAVNLNADYTTTTLTQSLATSANSYVIVSATDWNAVGGATTTLTPAGFVLDAHETNGVVDNTSSGNQYSSRGGHWADSGSPATVSYGVTLPDTGTRYNLVAVELLASGGTDATAPAILPAAVSALPVPAVGSLSGPATAATAADLGGGQGSWSNVTNAQGGDDGTVATWAVP